MGLDGRPKRIGSTARRFGSIAHSRWSAPTARVCSHYARVCRPWGAGLQTRSPRFATCSRWSAPTPEYTTLARGSTDLGAQACRPSRLGLHLGDCSSTWRMGGHGLPAPGVCSPGATTSPKLWLIQGSGFAASPCSIKQCSSQ